MINWLTIDDLYQYGGFNPGFRGNYTNRTITTIVGRAIEIRMVDGGYEYVSFDSVLPDGDPIDVYEWRGFSDYGSTISDNMIMVPSELPIRVIHFSVQRSKVFPYYAISWWGPSIYSDVAYSFPILYTELTQSGYITDNLESSSSMSSSSSSSSTSSGSSQSIYVPSESSTSESDQETETQITYYSNFIDMKSISSPIIDNAAFMRCGGFLEKDWNESDFEHGGYGLRKTRANQGTIYCEDASRLFSGERGYVGMVINLPYEISRGVYRPLKNSISTINENILWGVNVGKTEPSLPSVYAKLTNNGIEFTIWSSVGKFTLTDTYSDLPANEDIFFEFIWSSRRLDDFSLVDFDTKMILRINGSNILMGNPPSRIDSFSNLNFSVLDTPFVYSNMECIVRQLITANGVPSWLVQEWHSSSSSSSSS